MSKFIFIAASLLIVGSAAAADIPLKNAGFEEPIVGKRIPGWSRTQHAGVGAYVVSTDSKDAAHGKSSIRMYRTTEQVYGLIMQRVENKDLGGKEIEMTAMLKTAEVGKLGWVMVMTFKNFGEILDQVRATPLVGDTAWKEVVLKKAAPERTNMIELGFMLMDEGTGWADHVRLRTIDEDEQAPAAKGEVQPETSKDPNKAAKSALVAPKSMKKDAKPESSLPKIDKKAGQAATRKPAVAV